MIEKPIVLVLGAGASWDYGFPTGQKLKALIWKELQDGNFRKLCRRSGIDPDLSDEKAERFKKSLEITPDSSIDSFLEYNFDEFGEAGKAAIASVLLPYEKEMNLYTGWMKKALVDTDIHGCDIPSNAQNWYSYLFNKMSEGCSFEDFKNNKLKVVTFNYDRSFEWFIVKSLSAKYQKKIEECKEVLDSIPIIHIYGQLGAIWCDSEQETEILYDSWRESGEVQKTIAIRNAADSIKIIHEGYDFKIIKECQDAFKYAEKIFFLGFGYHMTNMQRLFGEIGNLSGMGLGQTKYNILQDEMNIYKGIRDKCIGTALGVSPHHKKQLKKFGLSRIDGNANIGGSPQNRYLPFFPDSTIYDFLVYNEFAEL